MELKNAVLLLFFLLFLWWMYQKGEIAQKYQCSYLFVNAAKPY